jgi:hypothetical protein
MIEALAATPGKDAEAHSRRYFGEELPAIMDEIHPLLFFINKYLSEQLKLPGLYDWLNATNFGNHYAMIKVFKAWSEMKVEAPQPSRLAGWCGCTGECKQPPFICPNANG